MLFSRYVLKPLSFSLVTGTVGALIVDLSKEVGGAFAIVSMVALVFTIYRLSVYFSTPKYLRTLADHIYKYPDKIKIEKLKTPGVKKRVVFDGAVQVSYQVVKVRRDIERVQWLGYMSTEEHTTLVYKALKYGQDTLKDKKSELQVRVENLL
jgi:hypothetical protein